MAKKRFVLSLIIAILFASCSAPQQGDVSRGAILFNQRFIGKSGDAAGCGMCHSVIPNEIIVGPSLNNIVARAEQRIKDPSYTGKAKTAPEYLRESILNPNIFLVPDFGEIIMYTEYRNELTEQEIDDIVAFVMTLK